MVLQEIREALIGKVLERYTRRFDLDSNTEEVILDNYLVTDVIYLTKAKVYKVEGQSRLNIPQNTDALLFTYEELDSLLARGSLTYALEGTNHTWRSQTETRILAPLYLKESHPTHYIPSQGGEGEEDLPTPGK